MNDKIKTIFKNSKIFINKNHDEAFLVFEDFEKKEFKTNILVNFDTHSDIIVNTKNEKLNIGNWVNYCIKHLNIDTIYWILPSYIVDSHTNKIMYEKENEKPNNKNFIGHQNITLTPLKNNKKTFFYFIDTDELFEENHINKLDKQLKKFNINENILSKTNYKKIEIIILTMDELVQLKNKDVLLSVDADFFCNTGFDTLKRINNQLTSKEQLISLFEEFIDKLYLNKINPLCTSLTQSPIYFPQKFKAEINDFYLKIYHSND